MTENEKKLCRALLDALLTCRVARDAVDDETDRLIVGQRPNWKRACTTIHNEVDSRPEQWLALLEELGFEVPEEVKG